MASKQLIALTLLQFALKVLCVLGPANNNDASSLEQLNLCPHGCSCMGESITCESWIPTEIPLPMPPSTSIVALTNFPFTKINETFFYKTPHLRWLQITKSGLQEFPRFPKLLRLSFLDLSHNRITHLPEKSFDHIPYIIQLNLSSNAIQTFHNRFFEGLTNLRILDLSNNRFIHSPSRIFFSFVKSINYLDLSSTNLKHPLDWANKLTFLNFLNLSHNNIVSLDSLQSNVLGVLDVSFNPLVEMFNLETLPNLSECYASHTEVSSLQQVHFSQCNHLKILDLSHTKITQVSNNILKHCDQLKVMLLHNNNNLTLLEKYALDGLTELSKLELSNCPKLHELEQGIFNSTPNLNELHLSNTGLEVLPYSLTSLTNLTVFNLHNTPLLCNCHARWIPHWIETLNISLFKGVSPLECQENGLMDIRSLQKHIDGLECQETTIYMPHHWITLEFAEETAVLHCNVSGNPPPEIMWLTPSRAVHIHNKSEHNMWLNHKIGSAIARAVHDDGEKFQVLEDGTLLINKLNRDDIGRYRCFAYNDVSNASIEMFLGIRDDPFRALVAQSYMVGISCALLFLFTTLIVQLVKRLMDWFGWECCCCKNRISSRAAKIKQLLESVELYKTSQLEKLRENYTSQVNYIKESCYSQMEKVRESYAHQSKNLKELCDYSTQTFTGARDQYLDQVNRIRDYSTGQMSRVRENYVFQRQRVRKYSAHQLLRLRETYKYQQKTLNKLLETLPDLYIQNCRSGTCQRTDSIIFDELDGLDVYYKVDFLDNQSVSSDYYTPSSTLTRPKHKHHSRNHSNTSGNTVLPDSGHKLQIPHEKEPHIRYHNRSYSLVPQFVQKTDHKGHKRSASASQTPVATVDNDQASSDPTTQAVRVIIESQDQSALGSTSNCDNTERQNRERKPSYETSL